MAALKPVAFDIETTGFDPGATLTVAGLATDTGTWLGLNTMDRNADAPALQARLRADSSHPVRVDTDRSDAALIATLGEFVAERLDSEQQYLCGYNAETWRDGFDLPFLRTACVRSDVAWPFPDFAYADVRSMIARFNTGEAGDLDRVHATLLDADRRDPFDDSAEAVAAFEAGDWLALLQHNLADLRRTRELAVLAGRYVPKSDFEMKNLAPP